MTPDRDPTSATSAYSSFAPEQGPDRYATATQPDDTDSNNTSTAPANPPIPVQRPPVLFTDTIPLGDGRVMPAQGVIPTQRTDWNGHPYANGLFSEDPAAVQRPKPHQGIDIAGAFGDPIVAAGDGDVYGYDSQTYGKVIVIKHDDGTSALYAHMQDTSVNPGDHVQAGQKIGEMGNTGNASNQGPQLHFEVWNGGMGMEPMAARSYLRQTLESPTWLIPWSG